MTFRRYPLPPYVRRIVNRRCLMPQSCSGRRMMEIAPKYLAALGLLAVSPWLIASASQDRASDNSTMISITGQGTARQDTRLAIMQAGVTSFATSAGRAWRQNSDAMAKLRAQLRRQ